MFKINNNRILVRREHFCVISILQDNRNTFIMHKGKMKGPSEMVFGIQKNNVLLI